MVALDSGHFAELSEMADDADEPDAARRKIVMLRSFDPDAAGDLDVADPYYGGAGGFTDVLAQVERSCDALLDSFAGPAQQVDRPPL